MGGISGMAADSDPVVAVAGGSIRGRVLPEGHGAVFKGVPFAQPPVGSLRWHEPVPVTPWTGMREADKSGPPAAQAAFGWNDAAAAASNEDCLYLDVWTPTGLTPAHLPVMVWLHGGGNVAGSGGFDPLYEGEALISHGVVLVIVEYRLGVFGYFAHPELTRESPHHVSGNYGLLDQLAALQWVRANIAKFGGDPGNVTLFGQSAGAIDVLALMASPLSHGLFHRAIAESGMLLPMLYRPLVESEQAGVAATAKLKPPGQEALPYLRSLSVTDLLKAMPGVSQLSVDGWVFTAAPVATWAAGGAQPVPLILGSNAVELPSSGSPDDLRLMIKGIFQGLAPRALELYGLAGKDGLAPDPLYGNAGDQLGSDFFRCPAIVQTEWHSAAGHPTWAYEFQRAIPPQPRVQHSSELPYVFGNLYASGSQGGKFEAADHRLSATIQGYWTNFARTGNPNGPGLPTWDNFDRTGRKYLVFTTTGDVVTKQNQRGPFVDLFRDLLSPAKP